MDSPSTAGQPVALLVSVLLLLGVAVVGVAAAGPDVLAPDANSMAAPEEPTVPAEQPEEGEESANETYLREALGDDFEIDGNEVITESADGLPEELTAYATVSLVQVGDGQFRCARGAGADEPGCQEREVADRGSVLIEKAGPEHSAAGSNFGELTVRHLRDDSYVVVVQLSVLGRPSDGSTTELEEDVSDWLASLEEALIAAALDERMRPTAT